MSPNENEAFSNEEDMIHEEEEEVANCNQEILREDEEGTLSNVGSLKGLVESYLQIDGILITREL